MKILKIITYVFALAYIGLAAWYYLEQPEFLTANLMLWLGLLVLACWLTLFVQHILQKSYERIQEETDKVANVLDDWGKKL